MREVYFAKQSKEEKNHVRRAYRWRLKHAKEFESEHIFSNLKLRYVSRYSCHRCKMPMNRGDLAKIWYVGKERFYFHHATTFKGCFTSWWEERLYRKSLEETEHAKPRGISNKREGRSSNSEGTPPADAQARIRTSKVPVDRLRSSKLQDGVWSAEGPIGGRQVDRTADELRSTLLAAHKLIGEVLYGSVE